MSCSSCSPLFPRLRPRLRRTTISSKRLVFSPISLRIGVHELAEVAQNKVLVAATIAAAIGQLSKPFSSALNGRGIDLRAAIRSGGMPSTHSASVVAAATSLGLERGFSDSVFGMSVVFAAIVMYDAQGVRREVGSHAKFINKMLMTRDKATPYQEEDLGDSKPQTSMINSKNLASLLSLSEKTSSYSSNSESYSASRHGNASSDVGSLPNLTVDGEESCEKNSGKYAPLNESVGHTEIQVLVGALLGFIVSLAIDTIL